MAVLLLSVAAIAFALAVFAGLFYLMYRASKLILPKKVQQEEQRILSHRFYKVSGRGRAAYLILCLEEALKFFKQDLSAWEWLLRKLWPVTSLSENGWTGAWLDSVDDLLPDTVLTESGRGTEDIRKAWELYTRAGQTEYAMAVISAILEAVYLMAGGWSPDTPAHDPDALSYIDQVEETMKEFSVPLPSYKTIRPLLSGQRDPSVGEAFDGLRFSRLSRKNNVQENRDESELL